MDREQRERRERKALELVAAGLPTSAVAKRLRLTPRRIQQFKTDWRDGKLPVARQIL